MKHLVTFIVCLWLVTQSAVAAPSGSASSGPAYRVIVHPNNPAAYLNRKLVARIFLKKTTTWSNGQTIVPVDLPLESAVRRKFALEILGRSVSAVRSYWQQVLFSGRGLPPAELDNDQQVIKYVLSHPGAIGYIAGGTPSNGVKTVAVR